MTTIYSSPPLTSRHQKGKRWSSAKVRSLVVIVFVFLIFTIGCFFITDKGSLQSHKIGGRERGKGVIIKWRHWKRKLVELVDA
jgi:hypothetical protein